MGLRQIDIPKPDGSTPKNSNNQGPSLAMCKIRLSAHEAEFHEATVCRDAAHTTLNHLLSK
jgi:hypothetical protein